MDTHEDLKPTLPQEPVNIDLAPRDPIPQKEANKELLTSPDKEPVIDADDSLRYEENALISQDNMRFVNSQGFIPTVGDNVRKDLNPHTSLADELTNLIRSKS